ncbi:GAF domain-containing protein [Streptomyces asoensis]|uniref:GAF domain-containing protein n=1 Tax=Streptomyces asoensis TaxID=249586 RepID=UPI0036AEADE0
MNNPQNKKKWIGRAVGGAAVAFPGATFFVGSTASQMSGTARLVFVLAGTLLSCGAAATALYVKKISNDALMVKFGESLCAIMEHLGKLAKRRDDSDDLRVQVRTGALSMLAKYVHPKARCAFYSLENSGKRLQKRGSHGTMNSAPDMFTDGDAHGRDLLLAVQRNQVIGIPDTKKSNGNLNVTLGDNFYSVIIAPVYAGDAARGVLIVDAPDAGDLDHVHESFVRLFAHLLGIAQASGGDPANGGALGGQRGTSPDPSQTGETGSIGG